MADTTKRCTACKADLPLWRFNASTREKHGRRSWCRQCQAHYHRAWRNGDTSTWKQQRCQSIST
jgi:hypothetical protein